MKLLVHVAAFPVMDHRTRCDYSYIRQRTSSCHLPGSPSCSPARASCGSCVARMHDRVPCKSDARNLAFQALVPPPSLLTHALTHARVRARTRTHKYLLSVRVCQGFSVLGIASLLDEAETLAYNALPAALTADMWTHVYVQQARAACLPPACPYALRTYALRAPTPCMPTPCVPLRPACLRP
eukprot:2014901-Pleurochrysis_carterae.AAC.2